MSKDKCAVCGTLNLKGSSEGVLDKPDRGNCDICGHYLIDPPFRQALLRTPLDPLAFLVSAKTRQSWQLRKSEFLVDEKTFGRLTNSEEREPHPAEKADQLLLYLETLSGRRYGHQCAFRPKTDYAVCTARDEEEAAKLREYLKKGCLVEKAMTSEKIKLTMKGWERARELRAVRAKPDQAFIAMSFGEGMTKSGAAEQGFKPALLACGYKGEKVKLPPPTETIDLAIIADIKRSGLVLADFTENKQNVYYEAGYAMGLGTPVIRTCRHDQMDKLGFDVRQYPFIEWDPDKWGDFVKRVADYATTHGLLAPNTSIPNNAGDRRHGCTPPAPPGASN